METNESKKLVCISLAVIRDLSEYEIASGELSEIIGRLIENGCSVCLTAASNRLSELACRALEEQNIRNLDYHLNFNHRWEQAYMNLAGDEEVEIEDMYVINYEDLEANTARTAGAKSHVYQSLSATANWLQSFGLYK